MEIKRVQRSRIWCLFRRDRSKTNDCIDTIGKIVVVIVSVRLKKLWMRLTSSGSQEREDEEKVPLLSRDGSLIANEPWELFEITSAEAFGIYHAMAFIESNRTQSFMHRHQLLSIRAQQTLQQH